MDWHFITRGGFVVCALAFTCGARPIAAETPTDSAVRATDPAARPTNPLDPKRAFGYLRQICDLGPRPSGSKGMEEQQKLLVHFFTERGAIVT